VDKIALVKKIAKPVVGFSVSFAIANIVRNNVLPKNRLQQVEILVASIVIGAMVAEYAEQYTLKTIDSLVETWNEFNKTNP
jgi:hypothetical protein